jgi:hypothetical protein
MISNIRSYTWIVFYLVIPIAYCIAYAPFGIDNNDTGFVLGLSHQYFSGGNIYEDIFYVRPPVSIILHSFVFHSPFEVAPVLVDRIFVFFQMGLYSFLTGYLIRRWFNISVAASVFIAGMTFVFSAHNFPVMAWHTTDGIFFSVLAITFLNITKQPKFFLLVISVFFSYLAAFSKQPFYIVPIMIMMMVVLESGLIKCLVDQGASGSDRFKILFIKAVYCLSPLVVGSILFYVVLSIFVDIPQMLVAITSQTKLEDILYPGLIDFIRDWKGNQKIFFVVPISIMLLWCCREKCQYKNNKYVIALTVTLGLYLFGFLYFFCTNETWSAPLQFVDALYSISVLVVLIKAYKTKNLSWVYLLFLHAVAWAASISWGYTSVILFSGPIVATCYLLFSPLLGQVKGRAVYGALILALSIVIFSLGNRFYYSLEGTVYRKNIDVYMGNQFPALNGIYVTQNQYDMYQELIRLQKELSGVVIVLPNITLFNIVMNKPNPIGIDWVINAEIGRSEDVLYQRIKDKVSYVLVYKKASPKPEKGGFFGSDITADIIERWKASGLKSELFDIYVNPQKN